MIWYINGPTGSGKTQLLLERSVEASKENQVIIMAYDDKLSRLNERLNRLGVTEEQAGNILPNIAFADTEANTESLVFITDVLDNMKGYDFVMIDRSSLSETELNIIKEIDKLNPKMSKIFITRQVNKTAWMTQE